MTAGVVELTKAAVALGSVVEFVASGANALQNNNTNNYQGNYIFPSDLISAASNRNFYTTFRFVKYQRRSLGNQSAVHNSSAPASSGTIRLPLPKNLRDQMNIHYGHQGLGGLFGAGSEALTGVTVDKIKEGFSGLINSNIDSLKNKVIGGAMTGGNILAGAAGDVLKGYNTAYGAASSLTGLALNPFLTAMFDAVNFKEHNFDWILTPKNAKESQDLRNIIQQLKFHSLPGLDTSKQAGGGIFFNYPDIAYVTLNPSEFLFDMKPCVITNISIDYAPGVAPSFFKSLNAPTAVRLSMTLMEIEIWTQRDFNASNYTAPNSNMPDSPNYYPAAHSRPPTRVGGQ